MENLSIGELERAVRAAEPAAFLILPRILRRVIKQHRALTGFGRRTLHRKSYVIGRDALLEIVDKEELGLADDAAVPESAVLLARPDSQQLAGTPSGEILIDCWRLLFHGRVHAVMEEHIAADELTPAVIRQRISRLGPVEFDEVRLVLGQDDLLLPPHCDASVYAEFVAVYLELRYFAPSLLPHCFPGLENLDAVDELVRQDVDADGLYRALRPSGAPNPTDRCDLSEFGDLSAESESLEAGSVLPAERPSETKYRWLMRRSQRPASLGNVVRAAIYRARAQRFAPPEFIARIHAAIKMDVYRLIRRLQVALELDDADPQPWHESLLALVGQTPRGIWTAEARLLYDLQKVCVDHEREIYTVDLVEWALSLGRRPIKRQLPNQREVLMLKHLRSAARLLDLSRLSDHQRRQLAMLIDQSQKRIESRLREQLRPKIAAALDAVGLAPQNLPERVAHKKLIEELLDQAVQRGFLTMGDLRDAISRNKLKLPDLSEPRDLLRGDQLLRADRQLALALDGVYRRGEFYLRWMQRISSLGFGTRLGRFLTRFAIVPFAGAYVALAGVHHVWEMLPGRKPPTVDLESVDAIGASVPHAVEGFQLTSAPMVLTLGLFLLCLVNSAAFRRALGSFFKKSCQVFRAVAIEPIQWIVQSPLLQRILHGRLFVLSLRFVVKPLVWTVVAWWVIGLDGANWHTSSGMVTAIFLTINLLLNSRAGRNLEEMAADGIMQTWHRFGLRVITGLFWLVVDVFKGFLDTVERLMYSVDEWLRFRSGQRNLTLVAKAVLGLFWFVVAYVLRFAVNVLIEPQINPIKHFPVVTVSHKLLLPLIPHFAGVLIGLGMEKALGGLTATAIITGIPGLFGFLVWELKENWRLYAANRKPNLSPVPIGAHGETMARLLKPGFHSGTLPKRYAKLRRAERHARVDGDWHSARKHMQALHHVEMSLCRHVQREFVELFAQSRCWQGPTVTLDRVRLATNSVRLDFGCADIAAADLQIAIEVESGWLVAEVTSPGWIEHLLPQQRQVLTTAIIGLYKSTGIDLVRQQIEDQFGLPAQSFGVSAAGLVLWPEGEEDVEVLYDLHNGPWIAPQSIRGLARRQLPTVRRQQVVFADVPVSWDDWVVIWNQDVAGQGHRPESVAAVRVLP